MNLLYPCVAGVCDAQRFFRPAYLTLFEQLKIMLFTVTKGCTYNFLRFLIDNYLIFESVSFLFAGIKVLLFVISIFDPFFVSGSFFWASLLGFRWHQPE